MDIRELSDYSPLDEECIFGDDYDCYDCKFFREENQTLEFCTIKEIIEAAYAPEPDLDYEPDIDEAQEWEDFDPGERMEAMYGGDDDY